MGDKINFRLFGYLATLLMHFINLIYMRYTIKAADVSEDSLENEGIQMFRNMEFRYFTTWTVGLQIGYSVYGLFCDTLIVINKGNKKYELPKVLSDFKKIFFGGLVWPCSWLVSTAFWTVFNYDRSLIYPEYLDRIIMPISNHVIHSAIVPVVIWEIIFWPRKQPSSHARNIMQLLLHMLVYCCVFHFTQFEHGVWLYPIFGVLFGTIHFYLIHIYAIILSLLFYYWQWWLNDALHGTHKNIKNKIK